MRAFDRKRVIWLMPTLALYGALAACHGTDSLKCPVPQLQSSRGDLRENANDIRSYQDRFNAGFSGSSIPDAISALRAKYPDASKPAIENYLVAAYCPVAVRQAVGVPDQKSRLASFERAVRTDLGE